MRRFSLDWNVILEFVGCLLLFLYAVFVMSPNPIFVILTPSFSVILIPPISAMTQIPPSPSVLN